MKKMFLFLTLIGASLSIGAEEINWITSYDQAFAQAKASGKSVLVLITAPTWCGYCKLLEKNVLDKPKVIKGINDGFIPLLVLDTSKDLSKFQFDGYPTVRVYDNSAKEVADVYTQDPDRFTSLLATYTINPVATTTTTAPVASTPSGSSEVTWKEVKNVAQYGGGDWSKEVHRDKSLTLKKAQEIAASDPKITFFFITTGIQMVLDTAKGKQVFRKGDTVFFGGKPWYGSAPGLADAYEKVAGDLSNGSTKYTYEQGYFTLLNEGKWQHCDTSGVCTLLSETDMTDDEYFVLQGPVRQAKMSTWVALPKTPGMAYYFDKTKKDWVNLGVMTVEINSKVLAVAKGVKPKIKMGVSTFQEPRRDR